MQTSPTKRNTYKDPSSSDEEMQDDEVGKIKSTGKQTTNMSTNMIDPTKNIELQTKNNLGYPTLSKKYI